MQPSWHKAGLLLLWQLEVTGAELHGAPRQGPVPVLGSGSLCSGVQSPQSCPWGMGLACGCWPRRGWLLPRILQHISQPQWGSPNLRAAAVAQGAALHAAEAGLELCWLRSELGAQPSWRHLHGAASLCTSTTTYVLVQPPNRLVLAEP